MWSPTILYSPANSTLCVNVHSTSPLNTASVCQYFNITPSLLIVQHAAATLGSGNLKLAVQLPDGEDLNEWIAVNSKP